MSSEIEILESIAALRRYVRSEQAAGRRVGYAPTMGGLHEGHGTLIAKALEHADTAGASIFVNPKQFDNPEEVAGYPSGVEADLVLLKEAGARFVFMPQGDEMYPRGFQTLVRVTGLSEPLCGAHRPGHFDGVSTVVTKLLLQCAPDIAVFGEKDFQQLLIVRRLVADLDIPVEIVPCPTVRENDGLACSSRNRYLTVKERAVAPLLNEAMRHARARLRDGDDAQAVLSDASRSLIESGFNSVDYFELRASDDLRPLTAAASDARLFAAAWLGKARLIDNIGLPGC